MATSAELNKTAAELMQEQHEAAQNHQATVEDTIDEDDITHPSPPHAPPASDSALKDVSLNQPMSAKAAGKRRAQDKPPILDTADENAFPALGSGPRPNSSAPAPSWGSNSLSSNVLNGTGPVASGPSSSGTSTPNSGKGMRPSFAQTLRPQQFGEAPPTLNLPGRHRVQFTILNSEIDKEKMSAQQLSALSKKSGVLITTRPAEHGSATTFCVEGSKAVAERMAGEVAEMFVLKQKKKIEVPSSIKSHIIGKGGSNIELLEKRYKVKIQLQDRKDTPSQDTAIVEISGNANSVRAAEQEIMQLVKDRQPKVDLPVENIPPQFFPFIATQHAAAIQQWERDHGLTVDIPPFRPAPVPSRIPARQARRSPSITVSGDLSAARRAHGELSQMAKALEQQLKSQEQNLPRSIHPFIVGERGMTQEQFLQETGCVVILPEDGSEDIIIMGPEDRLQEGANRAMELAENVKRETIDVHKPFASAPRGSAAHSRAFQRYLHDRQVMDELRKQYNTDVVFPTDAESGTSWTLVAEHNRSLLQGRSELMKIIGAHPPERLSIVDVDPFFHPHLPGLCGMDLKNEFGVHMIVPDPGEDHVVLVYEGVPVPETPFEVARQKPTREEIEEFMAALERANNYLLSVIGGESDIAERSVEVPQKYHQNIRRFTDTLPPPTGPGRFPVQVNFVSAVPPTLAPPKSNGVSPEDLIYLRGQGDDALEELEKQILAELVEIQENEKLRNHKVTFDFPDKLKQRLVGKQGGHINELRKKYNVEIDTKTPGIVQIRGPPKFADPCKAEIARLQKLWADEVVFNVKVDPKHVGKIIGTKGENLEKLRKRGNDQVVILAPPSSKFDDSQSAADTASDAGSVRAPRAKDEFVIRGPRQLATEIKNEIEELHAHFKETSHEASVTVAKEQIPALIGHRGSEIEKLRLETGARIDLPKEGAANGASDRISVTIRGTKQQVEKAKAEIQKRSRVFDDTVTRKIDIDQKLHQHLIGPQGSTLKRIVESAGAPSTDAVQFPKRGVNSNTVTVTAHVSIVDKLVSALEAMAAERADETTETVDVPVDKHRVLIGSGGDTRKALESQHKVRINIPKQGSGSTAVKIGGPAKNVAEAKAEILRRTAKQPGETIHVPISLHHEISDKGRLFRELRGRKVIVDHDGHRPPPRTESGMSTPVQPANGDLPLITDAPETLRHSWRLVTPPVAGSDEAGTIPWILTGPPEDVAAAKSRIEKLLSNASVPKSTGYLKLSDPSLHKYIIGKGGSKINEIRRATSCNIQVPNPNHAGGEGAITILGTDEDCEEARRLILEAAENGRNGN